MTILSWISIFSIIAAFAGLALMSKPTKRDKSAYLILLNIAVVFYLASNIIYLINPDLVDVIKWLKLITLSSLLSSLFGLIHDSKPIFARFPAFLIYLPFITLFFYPLITDKNILTDLLFGTFQGGCIVVALMIYGIHQIKLGTHIWMLLGAITFMVAFISNWFLPLESETSLILSKVLVIAGIIQISYGIKQTHKTIT